MGDWLTLCHTHTQYRAEHSFKKWFVSSGLPELPVLDYDRRLDNLASCRSGATLSIDVNYTAFPDPKIEWSFNGLPLTDSSRISVQTDSWHTGVNIRSLTPQDAGVYKVKVSNKAGSKTASFTVGVRGLKISHLI